MGRSMSEITPALLDAIPTSASVFDPGLNRHFEVQRRDASLFQTEYAVDAQGKEIFRQTQKLEWIIGSGANGRGAIIKLNDYLFEAPLSLYSKPNHWALSPGYEFGDYGFNRPILPACINCHSGRPQLLQDGNGRFREPPFLELAIGCENCHGPGEAHIAAAQLGSPLGSITNPAKLSPWLADNICMSCHQSGGARVLREGKEFHDFRPGAELDETFSIFLVLFSRETLPKDDLLEHYLSMRLSKCYLASAGKLSCITCHDPHVEPAQQESAAYFRQKCLTCHTEKSCVLPLSLRQRKTPPDDCAGCHMPKRDVTVISHSVLTNHRIVSQSDEPFPEAAFQMTTPELPDLVHLSAAPKSKGAPPPLMLLEAYGQVMLAHPEYRPRYWALASQLRSAQPDNVVVLEALADQALHEKGGAGPDLAIQDLKGAIQHGSMNRNDFEQLASLLVAAKRQPEALQILEQGITAIPYDAYLYRLSAEVNFYLNQQHNACDAVKQAIGKFPQDTEIRKYLQKCAAIEPEGAH